jgi:hypothetical protein
MEELAIVYALYFATFSAFCTVTVPFIIEAWMRWFQPQTKFWKSVWSWIIPPALGMGGWGLASIFQDGFLFGLPWWSGLFFGAWAAVMANVGWGNVPWIKEFVTNLFEWLTDVLFNQKRGEENEMDPESGD